MALLAQQKGNQLETTTNVEISGAIDVQALKGYVDRVSRLMREQKALGEDIAQVCAEADEAGVASKREIRKLARESQMEPEVLQSQLQRMDDLRQALGAFGTTPLGAAAMRSAEDDVTERRAANIAITEASRDARKPKPFAEQAVHDPDRKRGRRAKPVLFDQEHPQGTA
jgi:uncharacterized protein (UPF0335 family)